MNLITTPIEIEKMVEFSIEDVEQVYRGTPGLCRCGCSGEYFTPEENPEQVKKILKIFERESGKKKIENDDDFIFNIEYKTVCYTIYLRRKE